MYDGACPECQDAMRKVWNEMTVKEHRYRCQVPLRRFSLPLTLGKLWADASALRGAILHLPL